MASMTGAAGIQEGDNDPSVSAGSSAVPGALCCRVRLGGHWAGGEVGRTLGGGAVLRDGNTLLKGGRWRLPSQLPHNLLC